MAQLTREQLIEIIRARESDPALMEFARTPAVNPPPLRRGPVPVSRAAGRAYEDPEAVREDELAKGRGYVAGALDLGGATSQLARAAGVPEVASWLEQAQAEAPGTATVSSTINPLSILGTVTDAARGVYDTVAGPAAAPVKIKSRDEFFQERRKPRETLEEARARAERDFMGSDGYKTMISNKMVTKAKEALAEAGNRSVEAWRQGQGTIAGEEAQIEKDYQAYIEGENRRLEAEHSKGFAERNPWFGSAMAIGGLGAGLVTHGLSSRLARKGEGLIEGVNKAREAGDIGQLSEATQALKNWEYGSKSGGMGGLPQFSASTKKALVIGNAAAIPMEVRGVADLVDKYGLPPEYYDASGELQRSPAQQRAEEHLKPLNFLSDALPAIVSGVAGAGLGAKTARQLPREKARAIVNPVSDDQLQAIANREMLSAKLSADVRGARQDASYSTAQDAQTHAFGQEAHAFGQEALRRSGGQVADAPVPAQPVPEPQVPSVVSSTTKTPAKPSANDRGKVAEDAAARKEAFWTQVERSLASGTHPADLNPADFKGMSPKATRDRLERIANVLDKPNLPPKQAAALLRAMRENDLIKLGVGAPVAAGIAIDYGSGEDF